MKPLFLVHAVLIVILLSPGTSYGKRKNRIVDLATAAVSEALVQAPIDQEVCFAPDEPCDIKLTKFIQTAQSSLDIAIFDINLDQLVHQILVQSKKKIAVRVLVDRRQAKSDHSLVPLLVKAGVEVRFGRQRGIMHNKFVIVDGKRVETGSFNYTNGAAFKNNENQIYLSATPIVDRYRKRFEKIWAEGDAARF